ncbi:hypothetical protein FBD94_20655 [Pedobacter hiemivivus]|uniref:Uncharacterized protein n=1 Tax=Pedobacter hiemivivus TaxID=2530454 RepID=A0A4V6WPH8_9SPHI|nr:hypothetical protein [Pedobacter hiemivivus]TKC57686.1 hypothetical protein FBD94_20655 [Pedobacter hiemivivus]
MKAKKANTVDDQLTTEQQMNAEVLQAFNLITQSARAVVSNFETKKYRTSVLINHLQNNSNSLVKEYLSYFFNVTLTRNKNSLLVIYIGFDTEAVTRFGSMLHNQLIREVMKHTMQDNTSVNIESCIRVDANTKDVRYFFYKRITEGENEYVTILVDEPVAV